MPLDECLPAELRGPDTEITEIEAGLSGAGVFRVDAGGKAYILKVTHDELEPWRKKLALLRLASDAGVAPRIVHADEAQRAIISELVVDQGLQPLLAKGGVIPALASMLRRLHDVPLPADTPAMQPLAMVHALWTGPLAGFPVPAFVTQAVERVLSEEAPPAGSLVLTHGDVNPTNLVFDGERLVLVDWDAAGANDPYYDLAAASVFLRLDESQRDELLAAYGAPPSPRFDYDRRVVAVGCGVVFLHLARMAGHEGRATGVSLPLADFYHRLQVGAFSLGTADGRWAFALALIGESV